MGTHEGAEHAPSQGVVPRRVWSGTALQVAGRVFGSACTFALLALLARRLETGEFGRYTFYIGVFGVLDALSDFGTGQTAIRLTSRDPSALAGVLRQARRMRTWTSALGLAALALFTSAFGESGRAWILLAGLYPFTHAFELTATVFKNRMAWKVPVLVRVFASAGRLGLVAGLALAGVARAPELIFATAVASGLANVALHLASREHVPPAGSAPPPGESLFAAALPLGLGSLCALLYFHVDNLFVRAWCGEEALGHYNAGVRLLSFLIAIAQLASATALPWLVRRHAEGATAGAIAALTQPLFAAAALGAGLCVPFSTRILELAFGAPFAAGGPAFAWLLGAVAVIHAGSMFVTALVAVGRQRTMLAIAVSGLALNLVGNALLVPRLGIEGAAITTVATELAVALAALAALARAGIRPLAKRPLAWVAAPLLFALGAALASLVA